MLEAASANLTSPPVLGFALGGLAVAAGSDLRLPAAIQSLLSTYLLLAIGIKGGYALSGTTMGDFAAPALMTVAFGVVTPVVVFLLVRRLGRLSPVDAAGLAAHYGSVSVVTFTAASAAAVAAGLVVEGFMPALVALLEVPGIVVALALAARAGQGSGLGAAWREAITAKSAMLLAGGLMVGALGGEAGFTAVSPLFVDLFPGLLVLFLLDLGVGTAQRLRDVRSAGPFVIAFALVAPLVLGIAGVAGGTAAGLGVGGAAVFGAMAASASYIAAPAAVQVALPQANLALCLTASLAVTFPVNLVLGIPLYQHVAALLA